MNRKAIIIFLSAILVLSMIVTGLKERTVLVVEEVKTGKQTMFYPEEDTFQLGYIHSVLLTPVDECFDITADGKLILQKTIYESFGVGLPYEQLTDSEFEIIDGKFILYLNRVFEEINMTISPIPHHTISVNDETIEINTLFGNNKTDALEPVKIKIYSKKTRALF